MELKELEQQYIDAKIAYYKGEPIMSDYEFDSLESELNKLNSDVTTLVGAQLENGVDKIAHPSKMLSLSKLQIDEEDFKSNLVVWLNTVKSEQVIITPKYDGNAVNLTYDNGELVKAVTRGNGEIGQDITRAALNFVPRFINSDDSIEVRGEVLIPLSIFEQNYKEEFKNPRNFVSGSISRKNPQPEILDDFVFIPLDIRDNTYDSHISLNNFKRDIWPSGYHTATIIDQIDVTNSEKIISTLQKIANDRTTFESNLDYLIDGVVISAQVGARDLMGVKSNYPNWAKAIKLPPVEKSSIIENIKWKIGSSGEFTPVAHIQPTLIDGSEVSRISMYNLEWVEKSGCSIGAKVLFRKSGDIIPKITEVLQEGNGDLNIPQICPHCDHVVVKFEQKKLICENEDCGGQSSKKLGKGIKALDLYHIGGAMIDKLESAGVNTIFDLFQTSEQELIDSGEFKSGRLLERMVGEIRQPKEFKLWQVINALQFDLVGATVSKKIAKVYCGIDVDWKGIDYVLREKFSDKNEIFIQEWITIKKLIDILENIGHTIVYPEPQKPDTQYIELTGSPKEFGFKTKNEFLEQAKKHSFEKSSLSNANYLVTDDMNSSSSKMSKARKKGIKIVTYNQLW